MDKYNVYQDISRRTGGELYFGVVGPVRTGKSTFIKRFMELIVLPNISDADEKQRTIDELPQSANGRLVMTTEPKFVPKKETEITFSNKESGKIRLIDCVGFLVPGAVDSVDEEERLVKTPWSVEEIPFSKAASIGTTKVIYEHSNVGIVITTDGSFGEIRRENFEEAEARAIVECSKSNKPFVIILNTTNPNSELTSELCKKMEQKYKKKIIPFNIKEMTIGDFENLMQEILADFPISQIRFELPKWFSFLDCVHPIKKELIDKVRLWLKGIQKIGDVQPENIDWQTNHIQKIDIINKNMENGIVDIKVTMQDHCYYNVLSELVGETINDEYDLVALLKDLSVHKREYKLIAAACMKVKSMGYGVIPPSEADIAIEDPELIRHGNKYGVKIKAICPSLHLIQANIETEIAPIVGTEEQAKDLIAYIQEQSIENQEGIFDTTIFGKTIRQLVEEGVNSKVNRLNEESQMKLQDTIQKVVNDSNGGLVCIII